MRPGVARDMGDSSSDFVRVVWPAIRECIRGRELIPVEAVTDHAMAIKLDTLAGIDSWVVRTSDDMIGLASRVQWGQEWGTFTVRTKTGHGMPTEYDKRRASLATPGSLYPHLTVQAYLDERGGCLLAAAVAKTEDIIAAVEKGIGYQRTVYDGNRMWVVPWRDLADMATDLLHPVVVARSGGWRRI